ncbi:hypothetical protein LTR37_013274 [Vermiconidia calcicola]|uniref:Uncharacterized protein n=1 Tax=Vermiconidia calcicola TaxID=1690605 RepID=A0ACC3MWS5_9PEZI|nr:hypothetical protein LTR37_013274 [Vermiconidia calcicola]
MTDQSQQSPGGLEDQIRRMILSSNSPPPTFQNRDPGMQPTVRLPSAASYAQPPHLRNQPGQAQCGPHQAGPNSRGRGRPNGFGHSAAPHSEQPPAPYGGQPRGQQNGHRGAPRGYHHSPNGYNDRPQAPYGNAGGQQRARHQQQMQLDPNAFQRGGYGRGGYGSGGDYGRGDLGRPQMNSGRGGPQQLFNPHDPRSSFVQQRDQQHAQQTSYLEALAASEIAKVQMSAEEYQEKDAFRVALERVCNEVCEADPERLPRISLEPFGSFKSGFASAGSDMDLVIVVKDNSSASAVFSLLEDDLPRALEKRLLELGFGARLLSRTRVLIIKICEKPGNSLLDKLREEREKWDLLPVEQKYPHLHQSEGEVNTEEPEPGIEAIEAADVDGVHYGQNLQQLDQGQVAEVNGTTTATNGQATNGIDRDMKQKDIPTAPKEGAAASGEQANQKREDSKPWTRERKAGPLDFPKSGVGIQCDINFFNPLGLHNTQLLRCYSLCDQRVRPMVLFVKAFAKRRKINSSYSGTLSSYGYVLMVLHYLVNVANPPVLPNLQAPWTPLGYELPEGVELDGWNVKFWRNDDEIADLAQRGQLTANRESLGSLLAGFFHYYSSLGGGVTFRWMQEVLSLRSQGGLLTKEGKGWVKAVTEEGEGKKIQHRYLFCIEDPFELNHNVARTVTHKGIVAIRDEFRRAKRILVSIGNGIVPADGELFSDLVEAEDFQRATAQFKVDSLQNGAVDGTAGSNGTAAQLSNQNAKNTNQRIPPSTDGAKGSRLARPAAQQALDMQNSEAFPSLGTAKPQKKKAVSQVHNPSDEFGEISGDKAKALLEEVKRKKYKAQAESTATLAAEAVLGDD